MTSRDISKVLEEFFHEKKSHTSVNNIAKKFHKFRSAWENSKLEKEYLVVFCDVMFTSVRRGDSYSNEGVYIAYGVRTDGKRELLCLDVNPTESANLWEDILAELKNRGVENIQLVVADGIKGLENKIHKLFPMAQFQKCVVHKQRQILRKTRPKEKSEMAADLKEVFNNFSETDTTEKALKKLDTFCSKWKKKYPKIKNYFNESVREYYFTYTKFPVAIRRMIYTTNSIENLNRIVRKSTKNKLSFESPETLLDYIFIIIKDFIKL